MRHLELNVAGYALEGLWCAAAQACWHTAAVVEVALGFLLPL